jgi:hypothetical protein
MSSTVHITCQVIREHWQLVVLMACFDWYAKEQVTPFKIWSSMQTAQQNPLIDLGNNSRRSVFKRSIQMPGWTTSRDACGLKLPASVGMKKIVTTHGENYTRIWKFRQKSL